ALFRVFEPAHVQRRRRHLRARNSLHRAGTPERHAVPAGRRPLVRPPPPPPRTLRSPPRARSPQNSSVHFLSPPCRACASRQNSSHPSAPSTLFPLPDSGHSPTPGTA